MLATRLLLALFSLFVFQAPLQAQSPIPGKNDQSNQQYTPRIPQQERERRANGMRRTAGFIRNENPPNDFFRRLNRQDVGREIHLTLDQAAQIEAFERVIREALSKTVLRAIDRSVELPHDEAVQFEKALGLERERLAEQAAEFVRLGILTDKQSERLRQIDWQERGPQAIVEDAELAKRMRLTRSQWNHLKQVYRESTRLMELAHAEASRAEDLVAIHHGEPHFQMICDTAGHRYTNLRRNRETDLVAALTSRQKRLWQEALGRPFHWEQGPSLKTK